MLTGYHTYEYVLMAAMLLSILANPVVIHFARRRRLLDQPGLRKVHASAIPRIGGVAIVFATLASVLPVLGFDNNIGEAFRDDRVQIITILAGGLCMFIMGLLDDVRGLRPRFKLLCQVIAALAVCVVGVRIKSLTLGEWTLEMGWISWPLTMLWLVGVTNAVNLIDGLDGLAGGISTITCGVVAIFAISVNLPVMAVLMLAMVGSLLGFLFLNFNPARIFMGDCGSLFLGFVIAASSVRCSQKAATLVGLALPFLALGVPIFDTLFSIMRRTLQRRGIFSGDRGHIHHRLLDKGLAQHQVALIVYMVTLTAAGLGLFMLFLNGAGVLAIFGGVVVLLVVVFRAAGAVRWFESVAAYRHLQGVLRETAQQKQGFDNAVLLFRDAKSFDQWWQAACQAAEKLQFLRLSMDLTRPDGTSRHMVWQPPAGGDLPPGQRMAVTIPMRHLPPGQDMQTQAEVYVNGSVESAGRRIAFFGRLLDEHAPAELLDDKNANDQNNEGSESAQPVEKGRGT